MLIDSHCHLDYPPLKDDLPSVIDRAKFEKISHLLTICTKVKNVGNLKAISKEYDMVSYTVGTHPHDADNEKDISAQEILSHCDDENLIGIGECGLDYFYEYADRKIQKQVFREHIKAAQLSGLPLIIHARDAQDDVIEIMEEELKNSKFKGVFHCFTGGNKLAQFALDNGFYISFSGIITFKKADDLREIARSIVPMNRILIETDAPYLTPDPHRGKSNEPAFIVNTAKRLAKIKKLSFEEIAKTTSDNFYELFTKFPKNKRKNKK